LLKRKVIHEQEFAKAREVARSQRVEVEEHKEAVSKLLSDTRASKALIERVPRAIIAFEEAFHNLELRQQKAQL
jgi:hypothetical protein